MRISDWSSDVCSSDLENPGDAGKGMTLKWDLPSGVTVSALRYPVPETLLISGLMNYVYEDDYAPLVTLTVPPNFAPGDRLPIRVRADWLSCTHEICVPEGDDRSEEHTSELKSLMPISY